MAAGKPRISVLLVDRHAMFRSGIRSLLTLEADIEVVGEGGDAFDAVDFARQLQPRVTLLGIRIEGNAFSATREIRQVSPRTKIIFLTMYDDLDYLTEAMESGASGYLLKTVDIGEVIAAIRAVDRGDSCIDRAMMSELVSESMSTVPRERRWILFASLTPIEREVLRFRAEGFPVVQISPLLGIDAAAVAEHECSLKRKLEIRSYAEMVQYALEQRLIQVPTLQ